MLNKDDLPVLPRSPRESDGRHWGMKYGFGWSNATDAPEPALLMAALMTGNLQPIREAVQHYGMNNVMAYWSRMRVYAPPFEYLRMPAKPGIWDYRNKLGTSGITLVDAVLQNIKKQTNDN